MPAAISVPYKYHDDILPKPKNTDPNKSDKSFAKKLDIFGVMKDQANEAKQISNTAKLARSALFMTVASEKLAGWKTISSGLKESLSWIGDVIDMFKFIELCNHLKTTYDALNKRVTVINSKDVKGDKYKQKFELAAGILGSVASSAAMVKLVEHFSHCAKLSKALGAVPTFPFTSMLSLLEIARSSIQITLASHRLKHALKSYNHEKDKKALWSQKLNAQLSQAKVERIQTKMNAAQNDKITLEPAVNTSDQYLNQLTANFVAKKNARIEKHKNAKHANIFKHAFANIKNFFAKLSEKSEERSLRAKYKVHNRLVAVLNHHITTYNKLADQEGKWKVIQQKFETNTITKEDQKQIDALEKAKQKKHDIKLMNWKNEKTKERLTIMQHSAIIAVCVCAVIFVGLAIVATPIPSIVMSIIGVTIFIPAFSVGIYKKYKAPVPIKGVDAPDLNKPAKV